METNTRQRKQDCKFRPACQNTPKLTPKERQMAIKKWHCNRFNNRAVTPSFFLGTSLLLVACAGTPPEGTLANEDMECTMVTVTGSNMPIRDCRPRRQSADIDEQNREAALNSVRDIQLLDEAGPQSLGADSLGF